MGHGVRGGDGLGLGEDGLDEVAEFCGGEFVAFEVGGDGAVAIDEDGVERVDHHAFIDPVAETEFAAELIDHRGRAGEQVPGIGISAPRLAVFGHASGRIVRGIEGDRHEDEIFAKVGSEAALKLAKIIGDAEAEIRKHAVRVSKSERDDLAAELGKRNVAAELVDEREIRDF